MQPKRQHAARPALAKRWKQGQEVGQRIGHQGRVLRKLTVERVTKGGRAVIGLQSFDANGRRVGGGSSIFEWSDVLEAELQAQEAERERLRQSHRAIAARREKAARRDYDALTATVDMLKTVCATGEGSDLLRLAIELIEADAARLYREELAGGVDA